VAENLFENIMAQNFSNLGKETSIQIQDDHKFPKKINTRRPKQRCLIIKKSKFKETNG